MFEQDYLELLELQQIIKGGVEDAVPGPVRVRAEVASVQQRTNGHCYLELCQSDSRGLLAKVRAIIWRSMADDILSRFAQASGTALQPGIALVFEVQVNYSELYGVSLIIQDIDFQATIGDAELRRRQTLERLEKEGLLDLQKEFALPRLPYRLAVVSAPDAAGYGDFRRHLLENEFGFAFDVTLFEATMQGDKAPASIAEALERIAGQEDGRFDAALILRGGGSMLDLACFDDYELCAAIARMPVPVFTAIGHDRDVHAADMVACTSVKTPTALADLFIDAVAAEDELISSFLSRLKLAFMAKLAVREERVSRLETRIAAANPRLLMERGYTLVTGPSGALLRSASGVVPGDTIKVLFPDGILNCTVNGKI